MTMTTSKRNTFTLDAYGVHVRGFLRGRRWSLEIRTQSGSLLRESADTTVKSQAEARAHTRAKDLATQELTGVRPDTLTLARLFAAYTQHKLPTLPGRQWKRGAEMRIKRFEGIWGPDKLVATIGPSDVETYKAARRAAYRNAHGVPLRDGGLDCDFRWLSSVFNWGHGHKLPTSPPSRLVTANPLRDCKKELPRERNVRRPIANQERYALTLAQADAIDPQGRLRLALTLARETGRRQNAILQLRASDVLLSQASVERALAEAGKDVGEARTMPDGALRWRSETDKQGVLHITPISPVARTALESYLARNPRVGDVPLLPGPRVAAEPLSRVVATRWLVRAEEAAELPKLDHGAWHPYRRLWASERRHLPDVDVIRAGGWKSAKTLELYQQSNPAAVLAAVVNGR
jgi:integrase